MIFRVSLEIYILLNRPYNLGTQLPITYSYTAVVGLCMTMRKSLLDGHVVG